MTPKDEPESKNSFVEFAKKLWIPIGGFIGAILLIYQLVQIWRGDTQTTTWIIAVTGFMVWIVFLGWIFFTNQTKKGTYKTSWVYRNGRLISEYRNPFQFWQLMSVIALIITVLGLITAWAGWRHSQQSIAQENAKKVVVVIAQFDGPEEKYGLRNQILEELNVSLDNNENIKVIPIAETVTIADGSNYARLLGKQYQADFIFWGWYRPTENPNITLHIENLFPTEFIVLSSSEIYKPPASIFDLESFSVQQEIGKQISSLITFMSGILFYDAHEYDIALTRFSDALSNPDLTNGILNPSDAYIYVANTNLFLDKYQDAYDIYSNAIELDPQNVTAYIGRGTANTFLSDDIWVTDEDFEKAIEINPRSWVAYNNRGALILRFGTSVSYADPIIANNPDNTKDLQSILCMAALSDFDTAIEIEPQEAILYTNRGLVFATLGDLTYKRSNSAIAYTGRDFYENAIADYTRAIEINHQDADAYYNRSKVYQKLGFQKDANADFAKFKELSDQK